MDRSWLETVHFLGLDLEIAIVAVMVAIKALMRLFAHLWAERAARRPEAARTIPPARSVWPPEAWRPNH